MDIASYVMLAIILSLVAYIFWHYRMRDWLYRYPRTDLPCCKCKEVKSTRITTHYFVVGMSAIPEEHRLCEACERTCAKDGTMTTWVQILMDKHQEKK